MGTMEKRSTLHVILLALFLVGTASAGLAQEIRIDKLPRPVAQTTAANKIAATLAAKDAEFRQQAADCRARAPGNAEFKVGSRRLVETSTIYSVEAAVSWYCGGAHPDSYATALTFDLKTGMSYDLDRAFHVGKEHLAPAALPIAMKRLALLKLHDCGDVADSLKQADLSLGVTSTQLIFYLGVPHVVAAG
jgi:hypothetical protein